MKLWYSRIITAALVATAVPAIAAPNERLTFTKDVLPILQENCQTCHRPAGMNLSGMVAPMSLMSYQEVRPWAKAMVRAIESKQMPPWGATDEFNGVFANERTLTDGEIATIKSWVSTGAARGKASDAPAPMEFSSSGWNFGEPDLVVEFPEPFFVEDDVQDLYHNAMTTLTEEQLPEDTWISSIEYKPGSEVVHHILGYASSPGKEAGMRGSRQGLGGNAPGTDQSEFPDGFGIALEKGSTLTFAMHYHKEPGPGTGTWDSSQIGLQFHDDAVEHPVEIYPISYGAFEIPPHHDNWKVGASQTFKEDSLLLGLMPHTHLRGKAAKYTAHYPDGTSELLLDVPNYDFNWQIGYEFKQMKQIPKGTRLEMELWYDNSETNSIEDGFNPDRAIRFGGPTTDEMDLAWITVAPKAPVSGD